MVVVEEYPDGDDDKEYANSEDNSSNTPTVGLLGGPHCTPALETLLTL